MLIYNFQKEFLGIDTKDLQELGYHDLSSLRSEVTDFADLFVKTPGFIHNFQHVHWIDFIDCADDGEIQKVIINANGKNFTANLVITYAYLTDNPIEKAYIIHLHNLRVLSEGEVERIHDDILQRATPTPAPSYYEPSPSFNEPPTVAKSSKQDILEATKEENFTEEFLPQTQESFQEPVAVETPPQDTISTYDTPAVQDVYDSNDVKLDIDLEENFETLEQEIPPVDHPKHIIHKKEQFDNGYVYNPEVASKELGLPLDLIEEFIQDFIAQAGDFKPELYASLNDGDIDNVKTLSHKLKGVAANLRVEDAFEVLAIINTTSDLEVIKTNLDLFYKIISKLAGEEVEEIVEVEKESPEQQDILPEETLDLEFKEELQANELQPAKEIEEEEKEFSLEFKDEPGDDTQEFSLSFKEESETPLEFKDEPIQKEEESVSVEEKAPTQQTIEINYSKEKVANEIGLDITSFSELFNDYISESELLVKEMRDAVQHNNFDLLKSEIMKLKGMSDNMRINNFNSELNALMHSTNQDESIKLIDTIGNIINQLSKVGA